MIRGLEKAGAVVAPRQVTAFRLAKLHLSRRAPRESMMAVLADDLEALLHSDFWRQTVQLLPYFDTHLLGHADRGFVRPEHHSAVYSKHGWVSSVLLVNGRVARTWIHASSGKLLRVSVGPFARLPRTVIASAEREAKSLSRFLGFERVEVAAG